MIVIKDRTFDKKLFNEFLNNIDKYCNYFKIVDSESVADIVYGGRTNLGYKHQVRFKNKFGNFSIILNENQGTETKGSLCFKMDKKKFSEFRFNNEYDWLIKHKYKFKSGDERHTDIFYIYIYDLSLIEELIDHFLPYIFKEEE